MGCIELALDWSFRPKKINVFQHGGDWERFRSQGLKNVHNFLMTVRKMSWACDIVAKMLLIQKKTTCIFLDMKPISATAARMVLPSVRLILLLWDYPTRGYWSCVKGQGVSASHCIAKPKCTGVNFSIVRFTLNSWTRVNEFRWFLSQFWTNFHDILPRQLSRPGATTLKIYKMFYKVVRRSWTLWHVMKLWDEANGFLKGDISYTIFQWKYFQ